MSHALTQTELTAGRRLLRSPDAYATALLTLCWDRYGDEKAEDDLPAFLHWDPETLRLELRDDYGVEPLGEALDKLEVGLALLLRREFWSSARWFMHAANVLGSGNDFRGELVPPDVVECAWALTEMSLLVPPSLREGFSEEVRRFLAHVLKEHGFLAAPDVLRLATDADQMEVVKHRYAADFPEIYERIVSLQREREQEVTDILKDHLRTLKSQLASLPLRNGDTRKFVADIERAVA